MTKVDLPYRATLSDYRAQARKLFDELTSGDESAGWRFKWEHPRFREKTLDAVRDATLDLSDAELVIAQEYAFEDWAALCEYTSALVSNDSVARFEDAVEAVVAGNVAKLRSMLQQTPELVRARSTRRHHAMLLHYIAANGVEGARQKTPPNAVEVAKLLLDAGSEVDALADMYDSKCTTMSMLVSSSHPAEAGLQRTLVATLLDYGAAFEGPGTNWQSALLTALAFGFIDTARALAERGAPVRDLTAAAGLGRLEDAVRLLPQADARSRHAALALAAQLGHAEIVKLLLDAGEDPGRYNTDGYHAHSTPLHQAIASGRLEVVRLLIDGGAPLDIRDTVYRATPLGWAEYCQRPEIAAFLRTRGASS